MPTFVIVQRLVFSVAVSNFDICELFWLLSCPFVLEWYIQVGQNLVYATYWEDRLVPLTCLPCLLVIHKPVQQSFVFLSFWNTETSFCVKAHEKILSLMFYSFEMLEKLESVH